MQEKNAKSIIKEGYSKGIYYDELVKVSGKTKAFDIWEFSKELYLIGLNKNGFLTLLHEEGFYKRTSPNGSTDFVRVTDGIIKFVSKNDIVIELKRYVDQIQYPLKIATSRNSRDYKQIEIEQFINIFLKQSHNIVNDSFLVHLKLDERRTLKDSKEVAYLAFKNVIVTITQHSITYKQYNDFDGLLLFDTQIIDAEFEYQSDWRDCAFAKFIKNIANNQIDRKNTFRSAIGYLLHGYNDRSKSQAVILYDEELTDANTPEGGTGKGIIGQALNQMTKGYVRFDGKGLVLDSQFLFQSIKEDTTIIFIDDVNRKFDIDRLNSVLSEGLSLEKKFKDPIYISKENIPKFVISSNFILAFEGTTRKRRQYIAELSNYYSSIQAKGINDPILHEHKVGFFGEEWTIEDWNGFYSFMIKCLQYYLVNGLVETPQLNMKRNFLIQKIGKQLYNYFEAKGFSAGQDVMVKELYEDYIKKYLIDDVTQRQFSNGLIEYLKTKNLISVFNKGKCKIISKGI